MSTVLLEFADDGVAIVSLNRPDRLNIFNLEMRDDLIEAIVAVRDNEGARAMLLRANGPHFSAGADVSEFGSAENVFEARRIRWDRDPWLPLWNLPQPSVAALHGFAMGSGLEMSLLCDLRIASAATRVGLPEARLGMIPAAGGTQSLARAIGPSRALAPILMSETIEASDALRRGIVHRIAEDVEAEARSIAARLAHLPPGAARAAKRAVRIALDLPLREGLEAEKRLATAVAASG
jgi:enoyl-CoA hydratase/carnithine racemase